jgi:hypothetical protein
MQIIAPSTVLARKMENGTYCSISFNLAGLVTCDHLFNLFILVPLAMTCDLSKKSIICCFFPTPGKFLNPNSLNAFKTKKRVVTSDISHILNWHQCLWHVTAKLNKMLQYIKSLEKELGPGNSCSSREVRKLYYGWDRVSMR